MVIFQILLLNDKRVISKERNTVRASNPRASLTWTDNTSKVGYAWEQEMFILNISVQLNIPCVSSAFVKQDGAFSKRHVMSGLHVNRRRRNQQL